MTIVLTFIFLFSTIAMGTSVCWLMLSAKRNTMTYSFICCQFCIILWLVGELLNLFSVTDFQFYISNTIGNFGICFIGPFWIEFAMRYYGKKPKRIFTVFDFTLAAAIYVLCITNPLHHLYYPEFSLRKMTHGIIFAVNQVYIYSCMLSGIIMLCCQCFRNKKYAKGQAVMVSVGALVPMTINLLSLMGVIDLGFKLTPVSFGFSSLLVLLATYRYGLFNVNAVAFEDALNSIEEGVIIFNKFGNITYMSKYVNKYLDINMQTEYDQIKKYLSEYGEHKDEEFEYSEIKKNGKTLSLKCYECLNDKKEPLAKIIIVSDITRYYQLLERTNELASAEQNLAIEQERNRIAQEVHDTAGHTFTMISSLAKLSLVEIKKMGNDESKGKISEYLEETESLSRSGITQLRCSINNLRDGVFLTSVTGAVKTVTDAVRDMEIDFCVQGSEDDRYSFCAKAIYESCRELVTNCLRYADANRMDIILKFLDNSLGLYVFDNGRGCSSITKHNGLTGITERINGVGGSVAFNSSEGNGFSTIIKIPIVKMNVKDKEFMTSL